MAVTQNGETVASVKTGRTGGLPYVGKGCYRCTIDVEKEGGRRFVLLFDGAMSEAQVFVNDERVCFWPYGYNAFWCDVTDALHDGSNRVAVLLENRPQSSRWYPGAGLFRKVRLLTLPEVHVPVWGTCVTTPYVGRDYATVTLRTQIEGLPRRRDGACRDCAPRRRGTCGRLEERPEADQPRHARRAALHR